MSAVMNDEVMNPEEAAEIKRRAAMREATSEILFHQRDNGQVWTWILL